MVLRATLWFINTSSPGRADSTSGRFDHSETRLQFSETCSNGARNIPSICALKAYLQHPVILCLEITLWPSVASMVTCRLKMQPYTVNMCDMVIFNIPMKVVAFRKLVETADR